MTSTIHITLDLERASSNEVVELQQGTSGTRILISLTEGILPYSLSDVSDVSLAMFSARKPDETEIANACKLEDGLVVYTVTAQTTSAIGMFDAQIRLYDAEGEVGSSPPFTVIVYPASVNYSSIESTSEYTALDEMLARATERFEAYQLPHIGENGNWWIGDSDTGVRAAGINGEKGEQGEQGIQGVQGEKGDPFAVSKVYASADKMNAGYSSDGVAIGGFVVIETGNVEDEENARLYVKGSTAYEYLTDLSGAEGMQGPQGVQGVQGPKGDTGDPYTLTTADKQAIVDSVLASFTDASEVAM